MKPVEAAALDRRVLVLAPTGRDAAITEELLGRSGIEATKVSSFAGLLRELACGAAAILVPEEALTTPAMADLRSALEIQPPWSDLPILVLTQTGANSAASGAAVRTLGNVTLLERPVQVATLVSAVRTALRARERQDQIRGHLAERARAVEALRLADRRKDEFLATLGHELRNPLAPLLNGLLLIQSLRLEDPVIEQVTGSMERQLHHLIRLVDDLLEVSRITRGLIEIDREPVEISAVLRSAIETSQSVLSAGAHRLHVDLPAERMFVAGDPVRLTQVFSNLLTNAAKYTDNGGEVWVTLSPREDCARISVRDNGIGIPPEQLESVFDMFMQMDRSNRRAQGGLGIGLTLVRSLTEMHGGRVEAHSAGPGKGSEFVVELPLLSGEIPAAAARGETRRLPARRVLVVDDNVDAADTLVALLQQLGAVATPRYDGQEALDALLSLAPEVVLLDIGMPGMDGYEVARRIRASRHGADILLVALTGWGQDEDYRRTSEAGFDHHLVKPVEITKLEELFVKAGTPHGLPNDAGLADGKSNQ